jgi:hypothetical protein
MISIYNLSIFFFYSIWLFMSTRENKGKSLWSVELSVVFVYKLC